MQLEKNSQLSSTIIFKKKLNKNDMNKLLIRTYAVKGFVVNMFKA